ncbi:two-component system C4-dicarboxylate transport sensor histidine kinase DctB [Pacificibacter maritimus]|uniref:C4-dicarboxylate transport sensor protein DctB n=1 Tax=Pacificibacter maritimus TaxID=762213 RepID=A0A3N4V281_9RHOB|nr:ATP-binding protein [Pacificibacter maritimus]RPE71197.1 two-component system C4-dicarboxylate transport sensor histidine kinase DctB [Pacificibacter maritimus]
MSQDQNHPQSTKAQVTQAAQIGLPQSALRRRLIEALILVFCVGVIGLGTYALAFRAELDQAAERAGADLALSSDRLRAGLERYRELSVILADHPIIMDLVTARAAPPAGLQAATSQLLQAMADQTGSHSMMVVTRSGQVLAATDRFAAPKGVTPAIQRAMNGALGSAHFVDDQGQRRFVYAAPVFLKGAGAQGAILVHVDLETIEWGWPVDPFAVYFTDASDVIFVSNRTELILAGGGDKAFPAQSKQVIAGHDVWTMTAGPYIPPRVLHIERPLPIVDMTAELLFDLRPVMNLAALQAGIVAAIALAFGAFVVLATERRRTLFDANTRLEARVAERTQDLEQLNRDLKRAQADLVQAGKLSALGEMSAGISHELNQPLMAIRSYSENAQLFLERQNPDKAAKNLDHIADLARRMGRIIKNLRAFARQENEAISDVDLSAVVDAALDMTMGKISGAGVTLHWQPEPNMMVRGGEVRLQQVVINLISNAVDAMAQSPEKHIFIALGASPVSGPDTPDMLRLSLRDTGSGIADPDKMFEPFYTTKDVGTAQGMGLGLSISYGLIQSFSGSIRGRNISQGGAEFIIDLPRAKTHT